MLRSIKSIFGNRINAQDGEIGKISDAYFDDNRWTIRYLIIDTGTWLSKRVLISPIAFIPPDKKPDWQSRTVPVFLTKQEILEAPDIYSEKPISRQKEIELAKYYKWPYYWANDPFTLTYMPSPLIRAPNVNFEEDNGSHLRSCKEVMGYYINAVDGDIGHVDDYIVEDESWEIIYFAVDTKNILPGRKVLISIQWIKDISWVESKVFADLSKDKIKNSPIYDPSEPVTRETEEILYDYYGRPKYWS